MKVEKMLICQAMYYYYVIKKGGKFYKFFLVPFREITDKDLTPVPCYRERSKNSEEAPECLYKLYGLEKVEGGENK